jgi:NADH:ubiquinone oxidoreductase subunit 6 (subunit J)
VSWRLRLATLVVAVTLTAMATHVAMLIANEPLDNRRTFHHLSGGWSSYITKVRQEWRPRILSNYLSSKLADAIDPSPDHHRMRPVIAVWTLFWYGLVSAVVVVCTGRRAIFYLFAFFACLAFGYLPTVNNMVYCWDLPALFFSTLGAALLWRGHPAWLIAVLPVAVLFKETAIVLCVGLLLLEGPRRQRLRWFGLAAALCVLVKLALDIAVRVPLPGASMTVRGAVFPHFYINMLELGSLRPPFFVHPLMVNAGTLVALWLLPGRPPIVRVFQVLSVLITVNLLVFGRIMEYRIFFELIPLAVFALGAVLLEPDPNTSISTAPCPPGERA